MDGTQFLVQWDEHPSHLATRLGYLLEHQSLVDVTLMCNTHTLKVHRAVLAACSPYFERQLGSHPLIVLKDMKFSVLKSLVEFMYCGETSVSEENLTPLLEAAKFFEVKGLSSMTKETVCSPNTTNPTKTFNGTVATPTTSGYGRGGCGNRGRGRGRGRPPLNTTTKIGSPTESAQILLSLSGNTNSPHLYTTSKNVKIDPSVVQGGVENKISPKLGFEPRRRGRKRGALNTAFRDRLMRDADTQMAIENLKRDLSDDGDLVGSPLLSSLLSKQEADDKTYMNAIKNIGLPTNVPILVDNGQGKLVTLSEDVLKTVIDNGDGSVQLHLGPTPKTARNQSEEEIVTGIGSSIDIKTDHEDTINEEMLQSLKKGAVSEAENEPEAVVLFEVTDNKKVEKYVVSAKEVSLLKALNEQLTKQKKELADITRNNNLSTIDVAGTNTKVAELKLKIGKTKSILSEVVGYAQGLREKLKSIETSQDNKSQMVQLEFIDGNGEKIEGYQVTGTLVDKKDGGKDEFLGFFDMGCESNNEGPLLTEGAKEEEDQPEEGRIPYEIEAMINDDNSNNIVIEDKNQEYKYIIDNDGNVMNQEENNYVVYEEGEGVMYDDGTEESVLPNIGDDTGADFVVSEPQTEYIVYDDKGHELTDDSMKSMGVDGARYIVETYNPAQSDEEVEKEDSEEVVASMQGLTGEVEEEDEEHHHGQLVTSHHVRHEDEEIVVRDTSSHHDDESSSFVIYPESGEVVHHVVTDVKEVVGDCCDDDLQNATDSLCPITSSTASTPHDLVEEDIDSNITTTTHLLQNSHHHHQQQHHHHHQQQHHHHPHANQITRRTRSSSSSLNGETLGCSVKRRDSTESDNSDRLIDKKRRIDPTLTDESL
ncbi:uncharacterized protein [Rhodnius prolixus]